MSDKARDQTVLGCETDNCQVLIFIPSDRTGIKCPGCSKEGEIIVNAATRNLGDHHKAPYV